MCRIWSAASRFYTRGLGLHLGRRFDVRWAERLGASSAIDLLATPADSTASPSTGATRDYGRHMADPFGHGFCLLDMNARGYDALVSPDAPA